MKEGKLKRDIRNKIYKFHGNVGEATLDVILKKMKKDFPILIPTGVCTYYEEELIKMHNKANRHDLLCG